MVGMVSIRLAVFAHDSGRLSAYPAAQQGTFRAGTELVSVQRR